MRSPLDRGSVARTPMPLFGIGVAVQGCSLSGVGSDSVAFREDKVPATWEAIWGVVKIEIPRPWLNAESV